MTVKEKTTWLLAEPIVDLALKYIDKDPQKNILKILDAADSRILDGIFPKKNIEGMKNAVKKGEGTYYDLAMNLLSDVDHGMLRDFLLSAGLGAGVFGTKTVRANREKYKCNIPFLMLIDPTSACNCRCEGCWAADFGHRNNLSLDEMRSIVAQGKELGTHLYMYTGGEPTMRWKDLITICEENKDCAFLAYTNGTLIDEKACDDLLRVGNMTLAISVEGTQKTTDARRGEGMYEKAINAMKLLKKHRILFGMSVCYTSRNVEMVTSDEFLDNMVDLGVKFGFYFNYMPIGTNAPTDLIPSPEQREHMYKWLRKVRNGESGKPLFVMDFQDDGEYVGGCIAGGRNYFHINAAGDMEPCVFIHFSDSNIREKTILEALQSPLFMAYHKGQPFNDNHLRPCPMLENPECLKRIIAETGARSTNLEGEETAESLCSKCEQFAKAWAPKAEELWKNNPHPHPKTQYYRDGEKFAEGHD